MVQAYRACIIQWLSRILQVEISSEDVKNGKVLVDLVNLTGEIHISGDITNAKTCEQLMSFLDGNYHVNVSELFPRAIPPTGNTDEVEAFGLCLIVLIACLQSRAKQLFMDAALDLDMEMQISIFRLLREPMSQLSSDQPLTRELILTVFLDQGHLELQLPEIGDVETTPIKLAEHGIHARQSWCGSFNDRASPKYSNYSDALQQGRTAFTGCSSPVNFGREKLSPVVDVFRVPTAVCPRKRKPESLENNKLSEFDRALSSADQNYDGCIIASHNVHERLDNLCVHSDSPCPTSPLTSHTHSNMALPEKSKSRRPTDLPIQQLNSSFNSSKQNSFPASRAANFVDFLDLSVGPRSVPPPLASPLASLQHILDSPLWTQKTRLREMERDRRRLVDELEKERAFRYELEALVPELRSQLDETRIRMTEAEAKAARLTRDLSALQDQAEELNLCRTELALREDEITNLKQRLNSFRDLLSHSRKLELENSHLRHECADHCQKIEQLSAKLSDVKDRQLVYAEVETLRSKLRDAEAQLAQILADSEKTEKDARRQQELYNQLKLQQSLAEVRRAANKRHLNNGIMNSAHVFDGKTVSGSSLNDIECEEILSTPNDGIGSVCNTTPVPSTDAIPLRTGENLGSVLESELHMARSKISRLQIECGVQTDDCLAQFPLVLAESLERLEMDEGEDPSPNIQDRETSPHPTQESTLQALTADRRGLSNELVRLHDELAESHVYAQQLTEQNADLLEKLASTESELQHQIALLTQAQQKWVLIERKDRETEERIKQLQAEHSAQLETLRMESLTHARCASQVERLQAKHTIEKKEMKRQLAEAKNEVRKLEADRVHLSERNQDLQRELITTQTLIETIIRSQSLPVKSSLNPVPANNANDLLDEWIETTRRLASHPSAAPEASEAFSDCSDYSCESDGSRPSFAANPSLNGFHTDSCAPEMANIANGSHPSGDQQHSHSIVDEIARLSTRTAMLESFALALSRHKDKVTQSTVNTQNLNQTNGAPSVRGKPRLPAAKDTATTAVGPSATVQPTAELHDLDTDADSSAYTDLSQVSPVSRNSPRLGSSGRSAAAHSSPIPHRNSQGSRVLQQSDPVHTKSHLRLSSGTNDTRTTSCNHPPSECEKAKPADDSKLIDPNRIRELHRRNRLQPSHLRSSYPVETQAVEPVHLISALHQLSVKRENIEQPPHYRQCSEPSKFSSGVLREVDEDNLSQLSTLGDPEKHRKTQLKSITNCISPRAAGYQPKPHNLQELTDAFIAASHDSSMVIDELSTQLKRSALTTPIPSISSNSGCLTSRFDSGRPNHKESSSAHGQRTSDQTRNRPKSFVCVDENVNPPLSTNSIGNASTHQRFRRPANPPQPTESTSEFDRPRNSSGDSLASSVPSSIAFEIPIERPAKKPGRFPVPRSSRLCNPPNAQHVQTQKLSSTRPPVTSQQGPMPMMPSDDSFRALATPIERNHRIVP